MKNAVLAVALVAWVVSLGAGLRSMLTYETTPTSSGDSPAAFPDGGIVPRGDRPVLVMAAHPRCPCTAASVSELARLMSRSDRAADAYVLLAIPEGQDESWAEGRIATAAAGIKGVRVLPDPGGREGARFGARSSGHVVVYGAGGELRFSGGITPGRGHEGDSAGKSAILAILAGNPVATAKAAVFGCLLSRNEAPDA